MWYYESNGSQRKSSILILHKSFENPMNHKSPKGEIWQESVPPVWTWRKRNLMQALEFYITVLYCSTMRSKNLLFWKLENTDETWHELLHRKWLHNKVLYAVAGCYLFWQNFMRFNHTFKPFASRRGGDFVLVRCFAEQFTIWNSISHTAY